MFSFKFGDKKKAEPTLNATAEPKKEENDMEKKEGVKTSPPWFEYFHKLEALFGKDPEITLEYDDNNKVVTMRVESTEKADALSKIIPNVTEIGNVKVTVNIVPANNVEESDIELVRKAFKGNPALSYIKTIVPEIAPMDYNYVVFKNEVVQFWNDNLGDPHGNMSTLYQDLAREILGDVRVIFTTDLPGNPGDPDKE